MLKNYRDLMRRNKIKFIVFVAIVLLIIPAVFFVYNFVIKNTNNYLIKNKYYGFGLETPKNWFAEENTSYSEEKINMFLEKCKEDQAEGNFSYQIGAFRFEDQKYPQNFGMPGNFPTGVSTGGILEIVINCVPDYIKNKAANYGYSDIKIDGVRASQESLNLSGFGKIKHISFFRDNIWYKINQYVYISPEDKNNNEAGIKDGYNKIFDKIVSSFKFIN